MTSLRCVNIITSPICEHSAGFKVSNSKCVLRVSSAPIKVSCSRPSGLKKSKKSIQHPVHVNVKQREWQDAEDRQQEPSVGFNPRVTELEWKEFEEAVQTKDLQRALNVLEVLNRFQSDGAAGGDNDSVDTRVESSNQTETSGSLFLPRTEYMKVLNTCQSAMDLKMVGQAYQWLQDRGMLANFGKFKSRVFEASGEGKTITQEDMLASSGLDASNLSPKKWGLGGDSGFVLIGAIVLYSILGNNFNIDLRPIAVIVVGLGLLDSIYLGGTAQAQALSLWPPYKHRISVHEAGHVLVAYLLGCPVRGVVLDAVEALKIGVAGQAGTQFWDETLERELRENRLTGASLDRYCVVLFAGIAAEGLVYGEAEGGESDENLYKGVISGLRPPWAPGKMSNHARWSVLQAFNLLKENQKVHEALVEALLKGANLASLVETIETTMAAEA